ncbi:hypothetical protein ACFSSA_05980 [Luteolibacter algae]|uniref:Uncharacterized protein n=1 Tax=Luteolibacter algae TaxID=454151 RepID=A0ABW5D563_9BACT
MARQYILNKQGSANESPETPSQHDPREHQLAILEALADGVDPFTTEELPHESIYQHAKVLRALQSAIAALKKQHEKASQREKLPAKAGKPWDDEEDTRLLEAFDGGTSPKELSEIHGRTLGAIQSRLTKKGRLQ